MPRLANDMNAGYYPIPPAVTTLIASHIAAPHGGRLLDPCAGEGTALHTLAHTLGLDPYAIELHAGRAAAAKTLLPAGHVQQDDYRNLKVPPDSFVMLYENPPYTFVDDKLDGRAEYQWLRNTRPHLQPGGLLVWVVPFHMLAHQNASNYLLSWFSNLLVYRFPDPHYQQFKQVVLFGLRHRRSQPIITAQRDKLRAMGHGDLPIPILHQAETPTYTLPKPQVNAANFYFRSAFVNPADAFAEIQTRGIATREEFQRCFSPTALNGHLNPLTPLKIGHMNGIIAAGHLNNQLLQSDGETLLIKGRSYKTTQTAESEEAAPDGGIKITRTETEQVVVDITSIDPQGNIQSYTGADLENFLTHWLPHLTATVAASYPPRYQFNLNGYGPILSQINPHRLIPLVGKPGLLPAQSHAAAAAATQLEKHKEALIVGEMGTGKTLIAIAVAACIRAKHTIILSPPHLVEKWLREIKLTWPAAAALHLQQPSDVVNFFNHPGPIIGVLKETTARSGSGWEHAYTWAGAPASHKPRGPNDPWNFTRCGKNAPADHQAFQSALKSSPRRAARLHTRCPHCSAELYNVLPLTPSDFQKKQLKCPACSSPLYQHARRPTKSQQPGAFTHYAAAERRIRAALAAGNEPWTLQAPPHQRHGHGKIPLAEFIQRHYKRRLDLLVADECHQYKASDSDRGYAFHRLAVTARKVIAMTGTIYGGKASTLFNLLHRTAPEMARHYAHNAQTKWVSHYGILQRVETTYRDESGKTTGNSRSNIRLNELPGGSPAMLPWLLNRSIFVSLADMGIALPDYEEIPVTVPMEPAQAAAYADLHKQLLNELRQRLVKNDRSLLAGYLQALISWPDSPWRGKVVEDPRTGQTVAAIPGLPDDHLYPKEAAIIDCIREEIAAGRRVLLLVQQTDTLDITPQWQAILKAHGLSSAVLKVDPAKREQWIQDQEKAGIQVIISHPKRVETGLDILGYPTIIFMGTEYSVYTILQCTHRPYRIGQNKPVKIYFYAYQNTLQEDALYLIASKMSAALRINGDDIADDTLAQLDELASTDMINALARIAVGQAQRPAGVESLQDAFRKANTTFQTENTTIGHFLPPTQLPEPAVATPAPAPAVAAPPTAPPAVPVEPAPAVAGLLTAPPAEPSVPSVSPPCPPRSSPTPQSSPSSAPIRIPQSIAGYTLEDLQFLLEKAQDGRPILITSSSQELDLPTIHSWTKADGRIDHIGFGYFKITRGDEFEAHFNGGGALQRTPSGHGWCFVNINQGAMPTWYDHDQLQARLTKLITTLQQPAAPEPIPHSSPSSAPLRTPQSAPSSAPIPTPQSSPSSAPIPAVLGATPHSPSAPSVSPPCPPCSSPTPQSSPSSAPIRNPQFKIPTTNLTFTNLATWCAAYETIQHRKDSSKKYTQLIEALKALPVAMCAEDPDANAAQRALALLRAARPPRGRRADHPTRPLIVALENRLQHGPKSREQPKAHALTPNGRSSPPTVAALPTNAELDATEPSAAAPPTIPDPTPHSSPSSAPIRNPQSPIPRPIFGQTPAPTGRRRKSSESPAQQLSLFS